jgi:type VI protein secretion system component Hcp
MTYTLKDVIVSSVTPAGSTSDADGAKPAEQVSIAYGQIEWEYTPIDDSGNSGASIKKGWNLEKNMQI